MEGSGNAWHATNILERRTTRPWRPISTRIRIDGYIEYSYLLIPGNACHSVGVITGP